MSKRAQAYVASILGTGLLFSILALLRFTPTLASWETFAILTTLATAVQLFKVEAPNHILFYASPIFFFAGVLLLPPFLLVLLVAIPHLLEWGKERWQHSPHLRNWYLQPFNIAMYSIAGLSAYWVYVQITIDLPAMVLPTALVAGLAAVACYVLLNHVVLGLALTLARGVSWRESGMLEISSLLTDLVLSCLGLVVAILWQVHPWFIVPALAPLILMYQALLIPQLKHQATIDAKTGLANAGHFKTLFSAELDRATRFNRPLAVIMADLDLLREVNNQYGHLAGDTVLAGIGQIIRQTMRDYDISGRFGGEEFALVAPETEPHMAEVLAERLRQSIADARFPVGADATEISVTMSLGVACFPRDGATMSELIHAADVAVYAAKSAGRDRVVRAADVPKTLWVAQPLMQSPQATVQTTGDTQLALRQTQGSGDMPAQLVLPVTNDSILPKSLTVPASGPPRAYSEPQEPRQASKAGSADQAQSRGRARVRRKRPRLARLLPQPGVAIVTMLLAVGALLAGLRSPGVTLGPEPLGLNLEAMALAGALVLAYQYPIHIRLHLKVQVSTMIYYLIAALLPMPLAVGTTGLGTLLGEISVRQQRKLYPSDIATAVGRWMLLVLLGSIVAHLPAQGDMALILLAICALLLGIGDLITLPLILASMTGERPLRMLRRLAKDTALPDGIQYLLGFLGILVSQRAGWALALCVVPAILVYRASKHIHEVQDSTHRLLESLADTVDLRDSYTGGHSRRVAEYCSRILKEMKLGGPDRELILSAARVHDIGKIGIPDQILNKPGPLNAEEWALMKTHPERGAEVLARYQDFSRGVAIVLHHHEQWNGSGYPHGLKGLEIPFGARVMAVADSFDAMTSDRPYRSGMSVAKASSILRQGRGEQWDPQVVDAFLDSIDYQSESMDRPFLTIVPNSVEVPWSKIQ